MLMRYFAVREGKVVLASGLNEGDLRFLLYLTKGDSIDPDLRTDLAVIADAELEQLLQRKWAGLYPDYKAACVVRDINEWLDLLSRVDVRLHGVLFDHLHQCNECKRPVDLTKITPEIAAIFNRLIDQYVARADSPAIPSELEHWPIQLWGSLVTLRGKTVTEISRLRDSAQGLLYWKLYYLNQEWPTGQTVIDVHGQFEPMSKSMSDFNRAVQAAAIRSVGLMEYALQRGVPFSAWLAKTCYGIAISTAFYKPFPRPGEKPEPEVLKHVTNRWVLGLQLAELVTNDGHFKPDSAVVTTQPDWTQFPSENRRSVRI